MKYIFFFFAFTLVCLGCNETQSKSDLKNQSIDFSKELKDPRLSDLVADIEVIPLSTYTKNDELVFFQRLNKVQLTKDFIFILDFESAQSLLVFDRKGNFLHKIGSQGDGPNEYRQIMDFMIENDQMKILDFKRIISYNLDGVYLSSRPLKDIAPSYFSSLPNGMVFIATQFGEDNLILTDKELALKNTYFPYGTRSLNVSIPNPLFFNYSGELIYRRFLNDTLFKISNFDRPSPYSIIDYGEKKFDLDQLLSSSNPDKYFSDTIVDHCMTLYYYENLNYLYLSFVLKGEKWIYIKSNKTSKTFLYKKKNLIDDITFDPLSVVVGTYEDYFIFSGNPGRILSEIENVNLFEGTPKHVSAMKELSKKIKSEDNSILFAVKFGF